MYLLNYARENRYLLFITENYTALEILKQFIQDQREKSYPPANTDEHSDDATVDIPHDNKESSLLSKGSNVPSENEAHHALQNYGEKLSPHSSSDAFSEGAIENSLHKREEKLFPLSNSSELSGNTTESTHQNYEREQMPPPGSTELSGDMDKSTLQVYEDNPSPPPGSGALSEYATDGTPVSPEKPFPLSESGELSQDSKMGTLEPWKMEPFILFGSSFPKDKEYTQVRLDCTSLFLSYILGHMNTHNVGL